ncbi:MAG: hypothetical protein ACRC0Y_04635 [Fusobacteriaceae bacterium]
MENIENILNGNIESRINAYVYFKELNSQNNFKNIDELKYIDFEEKAYEFFKGNNLTLNIFDRGKFFEYIKKISENEEMILLIDNLEVIQNILFNKGEFIDFFKEMQLQKFKNKVIFVFSDIRIMKIKKLLDSNYPKKNVVIGV